MKKAFVKFLQESLMHMQVIVHERSVPFPSL